MKTFLLVCRYYDLPERNYNSRYRHLLFITIANTLRVVSDTESCVIASITKNELVRIMKLREDLIKKELDELLEGIERE